MAKKESTQHKLDRVRAPRVHITYDVDIGDAIEKKELPFVVGVLGDFSGNPLEPLTKLKDRKFVFIDRDNFKVVNDHWGHHRGDQMLIEIARRVGEVLTPEDSLARLGRAVQ